jgi:hypothetical protein
MTSERNELAETEDKIERTKFSEDAYMSSN